MITHFVHALIALSVIIPLIFGVLHFLKKWMVGSSQNDTGIKLLRQFSLGNKERIVVVEVEDVKLIIGISPQTFNTLYVVEKNA